jgi:ribosomal protein L40E
MKRRKVNKILTFRKWAQNLLILLIVTSVFSVGLMSMQALKVSVFAVNQWSLPKKVCSGYYPSLVQLDGTIWLAYTTLEGGANEVRVTSSNDGGDTWSSPKVVFEAKTEWVALGAQWTTFLLSNGELWLAWNANRNPAGGTAEIWYTKSVDGGVTWSEAKKPYAGNAPWNGYNRPHLVEMQNKIWLFVEHTESAEYMTTGNRGSSWSEPVEVTPYYSQKSHPSADYVNGEIWLVYTKWDADTRVWQEIHLIRSADGSVWSAPQKISNATGTHGGQSTALIKCYNDKAFVFFTNWTGQGWNIHLTTSIDGTAWSNPEKIVDDINYYGGLSNLAVIDSKLWLTYTSPDGEIWYTTFEEEEQPEQGRISYVQWPSANTIYITVDNQGTSAMTLKRAYVNNGLVTSNCTDVSINDGESKVFSITYSWTAGQTYDITVETAKNNKFSTVATPPDSPLPADLMWQQWWFWAIVALGTYGAFTSFLTIRYSRKLHSQKHASEIDQQKKLTTTYKTCPNCGAQLPTDADFCGKCGTKLK